MSQQLNNTQFTATQLTHGNFNYNKTTTRADKTITWRCKHLRTKKIKCQGQMITDALGVFLNLKNVIIHSYRHIHAILFSYSEQKQLYPLFLCHILISQRNSCNIVTCMPWTNLRMHLPRFMTTLKPSSKRRF